MAEGGGLEDFPNILMLQAKGFRPPGRGMEGFSE